MFQVRTVSFREGSSGSSCWNLLETIFPPNEKGTPQKESKFCCICWVVVELQLKSIEYICNEFCLHSRFSTITAPRELRWNSQNFQRIKMKPPENEGLKPYFVDVFPFPNEASFSLKKSFQTFVFWWVVAAFFSQRRVWANQLRYVCMTICLWMMFPLIAFHAICGLFQSFLFFFLDIFDVSQNASEIFFIISPMFFLSIFILLSLAWHPSRTKALPSLKLAANAPENMVSQKESSFQTIIFRSYVRHHFSSLAQNQFSETSRVAIKSTSNFIDVCFSFPHVKPLGDGWKFNSGSLRFVSGFRANKKNLIQLGVLGWIDLIQCFIGGPVFFYRWCRLLHKVFFNINGLENRNKNRTRNCLYFFN